MRQAPLFCLSNELLCPDELSLCIFCNTNTDLGEGRVQNVCSVSWGVHPALHNLCGSSLTHCNIFSCSTVADSVFFHHVKRRTVGWGGMVKIVQLRHIL